MVGTHSNVVAADIMARRREVRLTPGAKDRAAAVGAKKQSRHTQASPQLIPTTGSILPKLWDMKKLFFFISA